MRPMSTDSKTMGPLYLLLFYSLKKCDESEDKCVWGNNKSMCFRFEKQGMDKGSARQSTPISNSLRVG